MDLKPTHQDTEIFGKGIKMTRQPKLMEEEDAFFNGLFGTYSLLGGSLIWLILATILIWVGFTGTGYVFIGIAAAMVLVWIGMHVVKPLVRWFLSLVD